MKIRNFMQIISKTTMTPGIRETLHTPRVRVFPDEKRITVTGHSRLEDPSPFYEEFMNLIEDCFDDFKTFATFDFKLNYLNTSSSKWLFHVLKNLQNKYQGKKIITINWYYERDDEAILEAGEVYQSLLNMPFNLIPLKS
jgi:SiaC family regulatory phosphoprotein